MNEKIKEIIENEMDCLITDVDFVIKKEGSLQALVNMLEAAINYTHCCKRDSELLSCEHENVRLALIAFEKSKHKFLSEKYRHEYSIKVVDEYLGNL